ncbi:hypothetical protein [uncultured Fibrella sp.]|uniref:hypothetical protein n=1 Tax=uncultured Fibrella sp. TaxID=1284596 RepID=UPI0035CBC87E
MNELLEEKVLTKEDLVIRPERTSVYNFERDITTVKERPESNGTTRWQVDIPRDGFYDSLPEQLFHRAKGRPKDEDHWEEIREEEEKQEDESRHFFLPFDNELNHQRAAIARFETQILRGDDNALLTELLKLIAPEAEALSLTVSQKLTLFLLITRAHWVVGNWPETAIYFSRFLQVPVNITYGPQRVSPFSPASRNARQKLQPRLGATRIGIDWIVPPALEVIDEGGIVQLAIGPLTTTQLIDFLPGGIGWRYVSLLAGYLFPVDADYLVVPIPEAGKAFFTLADNTTTGRLGMTTELSQPTSYAS